MVRLTREEFCFDPNTCNNHTTGIPAENYSQAKYYTSRKVYGEIYDLMVRMSKIGIEAITEKVHLAVPRFLLEQHDDKAGADFFVKTWSLFSPRGRFGKDGASAKGKAATAKASGPGGPALSQPEPSALSRRASPSAGLRVQEDVAGSW
jgi:hypothetical protein